ncbi:MAG: M15 family metallopeptidase, partial [Gammaproteobacteria bacterium]
MKNIWKICSLALLSITWSITAKALPDGFVYLSDVDPTIQQDIRYASYHNFIGRPIKGYNKPVCILTKPTALALQNVQIRLTSLGYSLKVYDCYRPQMAVNDFYQWSLMPSDELMKAEFYPRTDKTQLFKLGYIAMQSGHSRGSTVDLTIVPLPIMTEAAYTPGQKLVACYAPYNMRFKDNSIDMGTGYDCLDLAANVKNKYISKAAYSNRMMLQFIMM